jgi:WD40 repeat protein
MTHKLGKITSLGFNKLCIVSAGSDKTLKIVDFSSGIILYSLNHLHEGPIRKVLVQENRLEKWEKFSADLLIFLCRILTASNDKTACLLSIKSSSTSTKFTMKMECRLVGHLNTVCSVAALNNYAITGSVDKTVRLWTLDTDVKDEQRLLKTFVGHYKRVRFVSTSIHNLPFFPGNRGSSTAISWHLLQPGWHRQVLESDHWECYQGYS